MSIVYGTTNYLSQLRYTGDVFDGGRASTTLGWSGPVQSAANVEALAADVITAWTDVMAPVTDSDIVLSSVAVSTEVFSLEVVSGQAGGRAGQAASPNVAVLYSGGSIFKGPRYRCRKYFPGVVNQSEVEQDGQITSPRFVTLTTAIPLFFRTIEERPSGWLQAVPQTETDTQRTPPVIPWPVVVDAAVQRRVATQRRRLRR